MKIKDWYDSWIEEGEMNLYLISDTHFNHEKIKTHCQRPDNFTELIVERWNQTVKPSDTVLHLGDVAIGHKADVAPLMNKLAGRKILVRGNHDRDKSVTWWMENGFDFACDQFILRNVLFTHEPAEEVKVVGMLNIHGHLHNVWNGFINEERYQRDKELLGIDFKKQLKHPWQRLFAVEYTNYRPVELNKFISHPDKYQARGPKSAVQSDVE